MEQEKTELKRSEDERIRKEIIGFLQLPHSQFVGKREQEDWIAWLEKQGEQKSTKSTWSEEEQNRCVKMKKCIDISVLVAEIDRIIAYNKKDIERASHKNLEDYFEGYEDALVLFKENVLDNLEAKEVDLDSAGERRSEYSHFETIYKCGRKPRWNVGDTLACYIFHTDCEYENILGKVTKVKFNKKDWYYTFENGDKYYEESLLEEGVYKK